MDNIADNNVVPIAMATDDYYTPYCYVAIFSLIAHANKRKQYNIYVMENGLKEFNLDLLQSLNIDNVRIVCVDVRNTIQGINLERAGYLSIETYFRLFLPRLFPQYRYILYLDVDLIILKDVAELFDIDMNGSTVAVAHENRTIGARNHALELGNLDYNKVFNAGVMLMDTVSFEENKVRDKCLEQLRIDYKREKKLFTAADQDALNIVLYNSVTYIDGRWNCQIHCAQKPEMILDDYREQYFRDLNDAYIIHYAGESKPWLDPDVPKAGIFWDIAKQTVVLPDILRNMVNKSRIEVFRRYRFPYEDVAAGSNVAIYAAGKIGKVFHTQLKLTRYAEVVLWVDQGWETRDAKMNIRPVEELTQVACDYVIICVLSEKIAEDIRRELLDMGLDDSRIVWKDYTI